MMLSVALLLPTAVGAKRNDTTHEPPAASVLPAQVFDTPRNLFELAPVTAVAPTSNGALPEFIRVTVFTLLVVSTVWLPNASVTGEMLTAGAGPTLVPLKSASLVGELTALLATRRIAVR